MEKIKMRRQTFYNEDKNITIIGHIEYEKTCNYCETIYWAKKINSQYCSNSCRTLIRLDKKRNVNTQKET
jgi:predicted nucleic acid-binding Zn ribbon protein